MSFLLFVQAESKMAEQSNSSDGNHDSEASNAHSELSERLIEVWQL